MKESHNLMLVSIVAIVAVVAMVFVPSQQKFQVSGNQLSDVSTAGGAFYAPDVTSLYCKSEFLIGDWDCSEGVTCLKVKNEFDEECSEDYQDNNDVCAIGTCQRGSDDTFHCSEGVDDDGNPCFKPNIICDWDCIADDAR